MKRILLVSMLLLPFFVQAQIKGNREINTETRSVSGLKTVDVDLYADIVIDASAEPVLRITADQNLLPLIESSLQNGKLVLRQKDWIQPSQRIRIFIGGSQVEGVQVSVNETVQVNNLNRSTFRATAILGRLVLEGKVTELSAGGETGIVDASKLEVQIVEANLWDRGEIHLETPAEIKGKVTDGGQLFYNNKDTRVNVNTQREGQLHNRVLESPVANPEARFIQLQLKNNSLNRIQCYVVGPKPDGSKFSYGFPMNPGQVRDKDWSIGSKVYRVSNLGTHELLLEITAGDENQLVRMYRE